MAASERWEEMTENSKLDPWCQVNEWALIFGPWTITKGSVPGGFRYNLYRHDKIVKPGMKTAQEGKDYVIEQAAKSAQNNT